MTAVIAAINSSTFMVYIFLVSVCENAIWMSKNDKHLLVIDFVENHDASYTTFPWFLSNTLSSKRWFLSSNDYLSYKITNNTTSRSSMFQLSRLIPFEWILNTRMTSIGYHWHITYQNRYLGNYHSSVAIKTAVIDVRTMMTARLRQR